MFKFICVVMIVFTCQCFAQDDTINDNDANNIQELESLLEEGEGLENINLDEESPSANNEDELVIEGFDPDNSSIDGLDLEDPIVKDVDDEFEPNDLDIEGLDLQDPQIEDSDDTVLPYGQTQRKTLRDRLDELPFELSGFVEILGSYKPQNDPVISKDTNLAEARFHLKAAKHFDFISFNVASDFYYDAYLESFRVDVREANVTWSISEWLYIKAGRQILSWGVGDYFYINDLFPKDFQSFYIGRDIAYYKAPSDAIRATVDTPYLSVDVIYTPVFDEDRHVEGERVSLFDDFFQIQRGEDNQLPVTNRSRWFEDSELAWRISRNIEGYEVAFYGYYGHWKSPSELNIVTLEFEFSKLYVHGFSLRGNVFQGIGYAEFGYYLSRDDANGDNIFVRNSELRFLVGYEQEVAKDFTVGLQYFWGHVLQHSRLIENVPAGLDEPDEYIDYITLRLRNEFLDQKLTSNVFIYYSTVLNDAHLRFSVSYDIVDNLTFTLGTLVFFGEDDKNGITFAQYERNSSIFASLRFSF